MMVVSSAKKGLHPTAEWALQADFGPVEVDCTTAVVLKILDNKCKMLPGEKTAVLAVYDVVRDKPGMLFDRQTHGLIARARCMSKRTVADTSIGQSIHVLRLDAEARIPKLTMKAYKALLRAGLFG